MIGSRALIVRQAGALPDAGSMRQRMTANLSPYCGKPNTLIEIAQKVFSK
jgi:hypothetical protein